MQFSTGQPRRGSRVSSISLGSLGLTSGLLYPAVVGADAYLDDFKAVSDPDWTNAFTAAAAWSSANKTPVRVKPSTTPYEISAPVVVARDCKFLGTHVPTYGSTSLSSSASTVVQPSTTFPANRGLFEFSSAGCRSAAIKGLALVGLGRGTGIAGVKFPSTSSESGVQLADLDITGFTSHGITGSAAVTSVERCLVHENAGYGLDISAAGGWHDCRVTTSYFHYNRLGGLNIDSDSGAVTFTGCRFERSGQVYNDPQNALVSATWNSTAPGIRIRGGAYISFVQCDTDANNGPAIDATIESATPTRKPVDYGFFQCVFNRDGQGDGATTSTTSTGVKLKGWSTSVDLPQFRFINCTVGNGYSNDDGVTAPINPVRGVHIENTEFCTWIAGDTSDIATPFYFGASTDIATTNWRSYVFQPDRGVLMNAFPETPPMLTAGMLRHNGVPQYYNGTAWVNV